MATAARAIDGCETGPLRNNEMARFVVRQPILDLRGRVHAFKLRFRAGSIDNDKGANGHNLLESVTHFGLGRPSGLKRLTGALPAFVECSEEVLSPRLAQSLPPNLTILELPVIAEPVAESIAICQDLKTLGFRFALSASEWEPLHEHWVEVANYIKVDFGRTHPAVPRDLCARMQSKNIAMLADKVDTQEEYSRARDEGFSLFAGSYYQQPVAVKNRRPPANQLLRIDILKALQQRPMDLRKMSQLVMRDGPLAFQLLRFINSPICALRQEVHSIETALLALGDDAFRRIATLAIASRFHGDQPAEILCTGLIRARFCETAAPARGLEPFSQYMLGLLSLLPAMQGLPMCDLVPALPLRVEIREALMGTRNSERAALGWLESYERGDWAACDQAATSDQLNQQELASLYLEAVEWAESALHSTT
jgi:EAL and modified HD-GYP domain-containing signal transduction protein